MGVFAGKWVVLASEGNGLENFFDFPQLRPKPVKNLPPPLQPLAVFFILFFVFFFKVFHGSSLS